MFAPFCKIAPLFLALLVSSALLPVDAHAEEKPLRVLRVKLGEGKQDSFVAGLKRFSEAEGFAIRVVDYAPMGGKGIFIQMFRHEVKIYGANPHDPRDFGLSFFESSKALVSNDSLDVLTSKLTSHIGDASSSVIIK
ncbi:MAG TPA: hypothetical protein VHL98_03575 [Microvirga sp.]|jgi:hypothetical protein|nr:hypothetical protein [Microvirga sp.]